MQLGGISPTCRVASPSARGQGDQGASLKPRQATGLSRPPCRAIEFSAPGVRPMVNSLDLVTWEGVCPEPAGITELGKRLMEEAHCISILPGPRLAFTRVRLGQ